MTERWFKAGSAEMLILKLLSREDMYGYQITEELKNRSQDVFQMKAGTLYPLLHTLEVKEAVVSYERTHDGRTRRYYSITQKGRCLLEDKQKEWGRFRAAIENVLVEASYV